MRDTVTPTPAAALGLVGDGDDGDLLMAVQDAFGMAFGDEVTDWQTVGDMHAAVLRQLPPADGPGGCATQMAFHRLRRELRGITGVHAIRPGTTLREAAGGVLPREMQARFGHAGLRELHHVTTMGPWGLAGWVLLAAAVLMPFVGLLPWAAMAIPGAVLVARDPWRFRAVTVGQLAREVAVLNARTLMDAGADRRPAAVWASLAAVVAMCTRVPAGAVTPGTRFYPAR